MPPRKPLLPTASSKAHWFDDIDDVDLVDDGAAVANTLKPTTAPPTPVFTRADDGGVPLFERRGRGEPASS